MAKSHKPAPIPRDAAPQKDATLEERTRYLLQEIGENAGFLEQWIVHYLADLLEQTDNQKITPRARSEARAEIARVLPALWEQQIAREAMQVRQKVDWWLRKTDTLDSEAEQLLGPLLARPETAMDLDESRWPEAFRGLYILSELISRFWLTTTSAERTRHEVTSEAVERFLRRDEEVQGLQTTLARIVPDFAALDLTNSEAVGRLVDQTLLALFQTQLNLLTRSADDPIPPTRKGARRKRQA